jgi:hypothetical protein
LSANGTLFHFVPDRQDRAEYNTRREKRGEEVNREEENKRREEEKTRRTGGKRKGRRGDLVHRVFS